MKRYLFLLFPLVLLAQEVIQDRMMIVRYTMPKAAYERLPEFLDKQTGNLIWLAHTNVNGLRCGGWALRGQTNNLLIVDIHASPFMQRILSGRQVPVTWRAYLTNHPAVSNQYRLWTNNVTAIAIIHTNTVDEADLDPGEIDK